MLGFVGWWVFGLGSTFSFRGLDVLEMIVSEIRRILLWVRSWFSWTLAEYENMRYLSRSPSVPPRFLGSHAVAVTCTYCHTVGHAYDRMILLCSLIVFGVRSVALASSLR